MIKRMLVLLSVMILVTAGVILAADTADVDLTVTPVANESLTVVGGEPGSYDFGNLSVGTSSNSATAVTLQNDGEVGLTVQKQVFDDDIWDITASSGTTDGFDLFVATAATRPSKASFTNDDEIDTYQTDSNLTGIDQSVQVSLDPEDTVDTWYMINMPVKVSDTTQKTITVRFTGTSQ